MSVRYPAAKGDPRFSKRGTRLTRWSICGGKGVVEKRDWGRR